jgi:hypothetical protein
LTRDSEYHRGDSSAGFTTLFRRVAGQNLQVIGNTCASCEPDVKLYSFYQEVSGRKIERKMGRCEVKSRDRNR